AQGLGRQVGERGGGPARVHAPRQDEWCGDARVVGRDTGEGGVSCRTGSDTASVAFLGPASRILRYAQFWDDNVPHLNAPLSSRPSAARAGTQGRLLNPAQEQTTNRATADWRLQSARASTCAASV